MSRSSVPPPAVRASAIPRSIHEYAIVGNLHTAALVSCMGSIDWACLPRFASPSVFGRLLDPNAGHFLLTPGEGVRGAQQYRPSTNVLDTVMELGAGRRIVLTDFMPVGPAPDPEGRAILVRRAEAFGGPVRLEGECHPRFLYGREPATWAPGDSGWIARGRSDDTVTVQFPGDATVSGHALVGEWEIVPGVPQYWSVAWGSTGPSVPVDDALLGATLEFWTSWVHSRGAPMHGVAASWHDSVLRSELALKLLSHADTGAFIAAPTTSLPEWPGGPRNWDYRYVWVRDATFTAEACLALGHLAEARSFLQWVLDRLAAPDGYPLRVVYGAHGETDLRERKLRHLAGYLGSRPVRVGNAAADQWQLDIFGELLDASLLLVHLEPGFLERAWPLLAPVADHLVGSWRRPDRGMWETRARPAHFVHSKVMAWVGLDRAAELAHLSGDGEREARYRETAHTVHTDVLERGYDARSESFVSAYGRADVDAANLRIPQVGFLPFNDGRVRGTLARVERELARGPFVYRYTHADGMDGPEGSFLPCAFWRVEVVARSGERERARRLLRSLLRAASPTLLFSEEYDPLTRTPLGNYPQAFTHVAFLRAVLAVEAPKRSAAAIAQVPDTHPAESPPAPILGRTGGV